VGVGKTSGGGVWGMLGSTGVGDSVAAINMETTCGKGQKVGLQASLGVVDDLRIQGSQRWAWRR
jgi:hypothetical protein